MTVLLAAPPDTLDGRMYLSAYGGEVCELISPGLIRFDQKLQPQGDLAESFLRQDDRTWKFVLRDGLTFHDGSKVTSADVKATFEGLRALKSPRVEKYAAVDSIEAVDERTVIFHLKYPYAPLLSELTLSIVPKSRAAGEGAKLQDKEPIGAGPFKLVSWADEDHVELVPFEHYYKGAPKISSLHIRVVRDETTRVLEMLKGRADLLNAVAPPVLPVLQKSENVRVRSDEGLGFAYLLPNVRSGPLSDARVRQAICHGINTKVVVDAKFHGLATPATGFLPSSHWAYQPTEGCTFDPERAMKLLDEAGYPDPDGPTGP
ncbi:MAG: ABC transporter substrate-binding protein, partial [Myxococcaceae bacterium]